MKEDEMILIGWGKLFLAIGGGEMILALPVKYHKVIRDRFGLDTGIIKTLEEVAGDLGVTKERIRQMQVKAVEMMACEIRKQLK